MKETEIITKLKADPRNKTYTDKGIGPVFRLNPKSKILITIFIGV